LYDLSVAIRVTIIESRLISGCAGFPLLIESTLPALHMFEDFSGFFRAHGGADSAWQIVCAYQPGEVITLEIELHKFGFVFAKKTLFLNRLHDTEAVAGVVNTITLIDSDNALLVLKVPL